MKRRVLLTTLLLVIGFTDARAQYNATCAANCDKQRDACRQKGLEVYVTCGQQGGSQAFCTDKRAQAESNCMRLAGCEQCANFRYGTLFYCQCGDPFREEETSGTEGYSGTMGCDISLPPSCTDTVDNDGDDMIDDADPGCVCPSPIIIDLAGNGFDLTSATNGVRFDITGKGYPIQLGWTISASDDAWLALDRNGNGTIDNGTELFGNYTPQPVTPNKNGFLALAEFDKQQNGGNGDGLITPADQVFVLLRLWRDVNHNGVSEQAELSGLLASGVTEIELEYTEARRTDRYGNAFRYRAKVNGSRSAWDVFVTKQ